MELIRLDRSQLGEASQVLGAAFRDTPAFRAALRGSPDVPRQRKLTRMFKSFVATSLRFGTPSAVLVEGRIEAVSLAYGPGAFPLSPLGWLENGLGAATIGLGHTLRLARFDAHVRSRHYVGPHWYLFVLGVHPRSQGRGLGTLLLERLAKEAHRDHVPVYLETDDPNNVGYYQRFGFEVTGESTLSALPGVTMREMLKSPEACRVRSEQFLDPHQQLVDG